MAWEFLGFGPIPWQYLGIIPILSVLMLAHELGHFIVARRAGITVEEFGFGLPPRLFGITRGGIIYSLNAIPLGAFVRMLGEEDPSESGSFARQSKRVRTAVLAAGSGMNFLVAVFAFSLAFMVGWPTPSRVDVIIDQVAPGSPAAQAGILPGDMVVQVAGRPILQPEDVQQAIRQHLGQPISMELRRDGRAEAVNLTPRTSSPPGEGPTGIRMRFDEKDVVPVSYSPPVALWMGLQRAWLAVQVTTTAPVLLIQGRVSGGDVRPIGPVGMTQLAGQAVSELTKGGWWFPVLVVTGAFSAGLAVANMLPIPALDGGRLLFVLIEAIRGRRVPPERENMVHMVGLVLLLTLMVIISYYDVVSPLPTINWGPR